MTASREADAAPFGSVLLVDNRDLVHIGLRVVLGQHEWVTRILGARRGADAVLLAARDEPRVALVDLFVADEYGTEICRAIRRRAPTVRVLLTASGRSITQQAAHEAGASGFVPKDCTAAELVSAIRAVAARKKPFVWRPEAVRGTLSSRQQQILELMAVGATNRAIAHALGLSPDTVKRHTTLIYRRLGAPNRAAAVHRGRRLGLLQPPACLPRRDTGPVAAMRRRNALPDRENRAVDAGSPPRSGSPGRSSSRPGTRRGSRTRIRRRPAPTPRRDRDRVARCEPSLPSGRMRADPGDSCGSGGDRRPWSHRWTPPGHPPPLAGSRTAPLFSGAHGCPSPADSWSRSVLAGAAWSPRACSSVPIGPATTIPPDRATRHPGGRRAELRYASTRPPARSHRDLISPTTRTPSTCEAGPVTWFNGDIYRMPLTGAQTGGALGIVEATVPPGCRAAPHVHERSDETFYVISGEVEFLLDDTVFVVNPEDVVFVPRGVVHRFHNPGIRPATLLFTYTPGGPEGLFVEGGDVPTPGAQMQPWGPERIDERLLALLAKYDTVLPPAA